MTDWVADNRTQSAEPEHNHRYPAAPYRLMREGHGYFPDGCEWYAGGCCYYDFSDGTLHSPYGDPQVVFQTLYCKTPEDIERYLTGPQSGEDEQAASDTPAGGPPA
jgi:hypothetical protein